MIGNRFRSHKQNRPKRPTFRPVLESLESREVPSVADSQAAFFALPGAVDTLIRSMQARPPVVANIQTNLANVTQDVVLLEYTARNFVPDSRLQIDSALIVNGLKLVVQDFNNFPPIEAPQFVSIARLGFSAIESGALDLLVTGFFPQSSNDAVL
jgi:hypothetical protein